MGMRINQARHKRCYSMIDELHSGCFGRLEVTVLAHFHNGIAIRHDRPIVNWRTTHRDDPRSPMYHQ